MKIVPVSIGTKAASSALFLSNMPAGWLAQKSFAGRQKISIILKSSLSLFLPSYGSGILISRKAAGTREENLSTLS